MCSSYIFPKHKNILIFFILFIAENFIIFKNEICNFNISLQFVWLNKTKESVQFSVAIKEQYLLNFLLQLFRKLFIFFL